MRAMHPPRMVARPSASGRYCLLGGRQRDATPA